MKKLIRGVIFQLKSQPRHFISPESNHLDNGKTVSLGKN